jgi:cytosine/adenosine deaminase-related metal-dependent hydrolase
MSVETIYSASWLINPDASPVDGGALFVRDGIIIETGTLAELRSRHSASVIDFPGSAIIPGFVNAHTHLELTHFPSWKLRSSVDYYPRKFTDWIIQLIKISRSLTPADYPPSIHEGIRMCLESGTTTIGEIISNPAMLEHYRESNIGGRLYFEVLGQEPGHFSNKLSSAAAAVQSSSTPTLSAGLSPHSPYTINEEHLAAIRSTAASRNIPLAIHLSESQAEADFVFDGSGDFASDFYPFVGWERFLGKAHRCSSTELFDRYGLFTPNTIAVHCVHVSATDVTILKERGVHIALCPRSNDILDVGRAPVALFKKAGIPLALGTDSLASNNSLSIWDELRFALDTYSKDLSEQDIFRMVTSGGAAALALSEVCGSLVVGKSADFQVVGNCDGNAGGVFERVIREGNLREVYTGHGHKCLKN